MEGREGRGRAGGRDGARACRQWLVRWRRLSDRSAASYCNEEVRATPSCIAAAISSGFSVIARNRERANVPVWMELRN
jgi:hypothetical protein